MTKNSWLNLIDFYILAEKPNKINFFIFEAKKFCENRCQKKRFFDRFFFISTKIEIFFFEDLKSEKISIFVEKNWSKKKQQGYPLDVFSKKFFLHGFS